MQQQQAEIETIYQAVPIGLSVLDRELRYVRVNQRLAEMNGLSVEAYLGRTARELLPNLLDQAEAMLHAILELTPIDTWNWGLGQNTVLWDDNHSALLGLDSNQTDAPYRSWLGHGLGLPSEFALQHMSLLGLSLGQNLLNSSRERL